MVAPVAPAGSAALVQLVEQVETGVTVPLPPTAPRWPGESEAWAVRVVPVESAVRVALVVQPQSQEPVLLRSEVPAVPVGQHLVPALSEEPAALAGRQRRRGPEASKRPAAMVEPEAPAEPWAELAATAATP